MRQRKIPGVDPGLLIKDAAKLMPDASRRAFLRGAASLGALTLLTGCDIIDGDAAEGVLRKISEFNDAAQAALFNRTKLAPTYSESAITKPFPFNAYYREDEVRHIDSDSYRLEVAGMVADRHAWTLAELQALPQTEHWRLLPQVAEGAAYLDIEAAAPMPLLSCPRDSSPRVVHYKTHGGHWGRS